MKICFLAGADSTHSIRWIRYFADKGEKVAWISFAPPVPEAEQLISRTDFFSIRLAKGALLFLTLPGALLQIKRMVARVKPDLIHAHYAGLYGFVGALLNFHPYIVTAWGSDVLIFPHTALRKKILRFILRRADIVTVDGHNARTAIEKLGISPEKIHFIQFGVDTEKFAPKNGGREQIILSLRTLEPIYDIGTLMKAVPLVRLKFPKARFLVAGEGSEKRRLMDMTDDLGIRDSVQFVGRISHEQLPDVINRASVYVSTALSDSGLAMSTAEAMACGLPVIVTDTSDNTRWIENGTGGFVIPVKRSDLLAEKIIYLLEHDRERIVFGIHNRKIIEERNSYKGEMARMHTLYKELTA